MKKREKQAGDENFPVAFFMFSEEQKKLIKAYYRFAREADDIADNPDLTPEQKLAGLQKAEDDLYGRNSDADSAGAALRRVFVEQNFDFSLAGDLLKAFRQDASGFKYQTWGQLVDYCYDSAAPVGRFMLALNNESPSTYLPGAALCAVLQLVNHIQDIKYDFGVLKRVYIPEELRHKYKVGDSDLQQSQVTPGLRQAVDEMLEKLEGLLKDAGILPQIVQSRILKIEIYVIIYLTKYMIYKLKYKDFLAKELKLSKFERGKAFIKGLVRGLLTRRKTLTSKGL